MFGRKKKEPSMTRGFQFELGDIVKDKVTGFSGVVTGRCDHISGCDTFGVQPRELKDGAPHDQKWFDEPRLVATGERIRMVDEREMKTGADSIPQPTR
jgi:hypothetical protein